MNIKSCFYLLLLTTIYNHPISAQQKLTPDKALASLQEGNKRFTSGKSIHPNQDLQRIKAVAAAQFPFATIVGRSDSRVPNEIIFDQGWVIYL